MKRYLLTDFTTDRWEKYDLNSIKEQVQILKDTYKEMLFGEIGEPEDYNYIALFNASHLIKNLTYEDGKVYGDVKFFKWGSGKKAKRLIKSREGKFEIRGTHRSSSGDGMAVTSIITWDIIKKDEKES